MAFGNLTVSHLVEQQGKSGFGGMVSDVHGSVISTNFGRIGSPKKKKKNTLVGLGCPLPWQKKLGLSESLARSMAKAWKLPSIHMETDALKLVNLINGKGEGRHREMDTKCS